MTFELKFVPVIQRPTCCTYSCSLRSATFTVGLIVLVMDLIFLISDSIELTSVQDNQEALPIFERREFIITTIVMSVLEIVTCSMLLFGTWKERPLWLLPFIILLLSSIVLSSIFLLVFCILAFWHTILGGFIALIIGLLIIVMHMYIWVISYSYYRQLEEQRNSSREPMCFQNELLTSPLHTNAA